ncbi:MAG: magnesium chelatase subunit D family protein [Deltaproteobacteria bacterium]|jgi:magnesium chelatase subunit D|nr:magnesium chelatase subunit D family protein [Deltaproteobacteria bacterium]
MTRPLYPLAAVVGQKELVKALILCAINPSIGGVLIRGEKGTAKSTAARGLSEILPPVYPLADRAFKAGYFGSAGPFERLGPEALNPTGFTDARPESNRPLETAPAPFLTLPLNATEDRVAGGLDLGEALATGCRRLAPGLLAQAHQGILYVDEVNLLDDHLVDLILDAASSGVNRLEREGLSLSHPARFVLVGTMNPEEGELRPQFLDRFGLSVKVESESDLDLRVELMLRREAFDASPVAFRNIYQAQTQKLRQKLLAAAERLPHLMIPISIRKLASHLAKEHNVAGHRADLIIERAAAALAAWNGMEQVTEIEVIEVAPLVLAHRQREAVPPKPQEQPDRSKSSEQQQQDDQPEPSQSPDSSDQQDRQNQPDTKEQPESSQPENTDSSQDSQPQSKVNAPADSAETSQAPAQATEIAAETVFEVGPTFGVVPIRSPFDRIRRKGSGRRSRSRIIQKQGRYVKSGPDRGSGDIAIDATIRAAAPYQLNREKRPGLTVAIEPPDFREAIREKKMGNYLFFTVDASGSMGARGRMAASKGAVMSLLLDAYQKRDQVALITFRRDQAQVNLPLTSSIDLAGKLLAEMPVGGRTPLSSALTVTSREVRNALSKNPLARPIVIIITDGRGNVSLEENVNPVKEALRLAEVMTREKRVKYIVVDTEEPGAVTFGLAQKLADKLLAVYLKTENLKSKTLVDLVKNDSFFS